MNKINNKGKDNLIVNVPSQTNKDNLIVNVPSQTNKDNLIVNSPAVESDNHKHCKVCKYFVNVKKDTCILCNLLQKYGCAFCSRKKPLFISNQITQKGCGIL